MVKNIISEINRVKEIMGLEVLLEQSRNVVRNLPDVDVMVGDSMTPIRFPDNIVLPIEKGNEGITSVNQITMKNMLPKLNEFIVKLKKNLAVDYTPQSISIDSGASPTPANRAVPKGYSQEQVDFSYGNEDPDNQILADKRGAVILELLNKFIPKKWGGKHNNLDQDKVDENWKELSALVTTNPQTNSTKFVAINVVGTKKVKGVAIYGCGQKLDVSGGQGDKNNNWISELKSPKKSKVKLDKDGNLNLGKYTEGKITLIFDPQTVPDAFKITYNDKVTYVPFTSNYPEKMDDEFVKVPFTTEKGETKNDRIQFDIVKTLIEAYDVANKERSNILKVIENSIPQETRTFLQRIRAKYGKKTDKPITGWHLCKLQKRDSEWFKKYFGWSESISNYVYKEIEELGFDLGNQCGELNQWSKVRNDAHTKLRDNKEFKIAKKRQLVTYDNDTVTWTLDEEKVKELGGGYYNQRLRRAAEDASDPEIKKLLLQGVVGKPQGVTIDKIYGKPNVKIEAIAPLGGTLFTIGLKCESGGETS